MANFTLSLSSILIWHINKNIPISTPLVILDIYLTIMMIFLFCDRKYPNNLIFIHWNILFMNIICLINSYPIMNAPYHTRTTIFFINPKTWYLCFFIDIVFSNKITSLQLTTPTLLIFFLFVKNENDYWK